MASERGRTPAMTKAILVFLGVVVVAVIVYLVWPRPPASLSAAILLHQDEFPKPQFVLLPPSSESRLGREPEGALTDQVRLARRLTTKAVPCFFVAPQESKG